ncbi:MAG TPA: hypothetical protein VK166_10180 [Chitinophagaceae bacterium]|nr:hypothetical protein [Chitinophagaceae bacterium]
MSRNIVSILIFLLSASAGMSQQGSLKAYTDQVIYIAGEKIWLAGMKLGNTKDKDHPVRIYLVDRNGNVADRASIMDAEGRISCSIQLRADLPTDFYMLAVNSVGYLPDLIPIAVINPVNPPKNIGGDAAVYKETEVAKLVPKLERDSYAKRELVNVAVQPPSDMELQISVVRKDPLSDYVDSVAGSWKKPELTFVENNSEGEGQQLKMTVHDATTNELAPGVRVYASVLGDQANIASGLSDGKGSALIAIPYLYGNASLVLSAIGETGRSYRVVYEEPQVQIKGELGLPLLKLEERFRASINERLLNTEVTNKYRPETKLRYVTGNLDTTDFYGKPDKRYMLDDYTRIPNMEEILYEYVQEARVRKLGEKPSILVFNTPFKSFFELPAMVLLDGVPVSDISQLLALDPLQLKSIDVVARKFLLDDLQIPGIVHYKSYKADLGGYKLPAQDIVYAVQGNAIPIEPLFASFGKDSDQRLPELRNLLYWTAFHPSEVFKWSFYTPDNEGEYTLVVRGLDKQGKEYRGEVVVKVK